MSNRLIQIQAAPGIWPPTWPMGLTMTRLLLLPVFIWALLKDVHEPTRSYHWFAVGVYAVMAITDKLDGYLARKLNQTTKLGTILDPVADKLLIACSVILLSFNWIAPKYFAIPLWVVAAIYGKDLLVALGSLVVLSLTGKLRIIARPLGKASTVLQLSLVLAVLMAPDETAGRFALWRGLVVVLWWAVTAVALMACADYVREGFRQLAQYRQAMPAMGATEPAGVQKSES